MLYNDFLTKKQTIIPPSGFDIDIADLNDGLFDWQKDIVKWAIKKGRCALFEDCGMGKTVQQLEWAKVINEHTNEPILILAPLAVSEQTHREGRKFGINVKVCRTQNDAINGVNITNYEMLDHFNPSAFSGIVLDESSILKHHSSKMRAEITESFKNTPYKLACTATPAPNDHMELCNHAEFLGVMSRVEMLSTFFVHDGGDTSKWRLKGHAEDAFWRWLSTWALALTSPADIGYSPDGFILPKLNMAERVVKSEILEDADGQILLMSAVAQTLNERRNARRKSLDGRCQAAAEIANATNDQCLVWCDLNDESALLTELINGAVEVRGSDKPDDKAARMINFSNGEIRCLITKPSIAGFGMNWQNCSKMIFVGLSDSYEMFYQAIRRCWRFGQMKPVDVYIIVSDAEGAVKTNIERKDKLAQKMTNEMTKYARQSLDDVLKANPNQKIDYQPQIEMQLPRWEEMAA